MTTIFQDGFESGDFSAWTSLLAQTGVSLSVVSSTAFHGSKHARITASGTGGGSDSGYMRKNIGNVYHFYTRSYMRVASADDYPNGEETTVVELERARLYLSRQGADFRLRGRYKTDTSGWPWTGYSRAFSLNEKLCLEVETKRASPPGANNGVFRFWLDSVLVAEVTGIDNDAAPGTILQHSLNAVGDLQIAVDFDSAVVATERVYPVGWFNIYDNDGVGPIDYTTPVATVSDVQTEWQSSELAYPGTWRFGVRASNACGEERNVDVTEEVILLASGEESPPRPNHPTDVETAAVADGQVELTFAYNATGEDAACTHFHVYHDAGSGEVDYTTPVGAIDRLDGVVSHYVFLSGALTDGQTYLFAVRAATAEDVEDDGTEFVQVTADATAPVQPTGLTGQVVR